MKSSSKLNKEKKSKIFSLNVEKMKKIRTPPPQEIEKKKNKGISNTPAISKR